jgi:hypothetical protein
MAADFAALSTVLLVASATLPGTLIALRMMCDEMAASVPGFIAPTAEVGRWARGFGL